MEWVSSDYIVYMPHVVTVPERTSSERNVSFEWCTNHISKGRFHNFLGNKWYFELEKDAIMFALKWSA